MNSLSLVTKFFLISFVSLSTVPSFAQCPDVALTSQQEVNNYLLNNPDCSDESGGILISGNDIVDLIGLTGIRKMTSFRIISAPNLTSLEGLDSLIFVGDFNITYQENNLQDLSALSNIDSIGILNFQFNENIVDLSAFVNLEFLNSLWVDGDGLLKGMEPVILSGGFFNNSNILVSRNSIENDFSDLVHPDLENLGGVEILGSSNFSFRGLSQLDTISNILISNCQNISLEGLDSLNHMNEMKWEFNDFQSFDTSYKLNNIKTLKRLQYTGNINLESLEVYLPNLEQVDESIFIGTNEHLVNISPLEWSEPPREGDSAPTNRILLINNPDLVSCDSYLLCKAVEIYPDSVRIEDNGEFCTIDYFTEENCSSIVSVENSIDSDLSVYPIPFNSVLNIEENVFTDFRLRVYNTDGASIYSSENEYSINLSHLVSGMYFLEIEDIYSGDRILKRVVKE
jgi:hypothetical protein